MNMHYGDKGASAAVFFDPPYVGYERLYGSQEPAAIAVARWCAERPEIRIALCGHVGDYDLPGWTVVPWKRPRLTYNGGETTDKEAIWFSPACLQPDKGQRAFAFAAEPPTPGQEAAE